MALALSTKAKIAAATLTAATIIGGAFSASAQQMAAAANSPNFAVCDTIKDPAKSAQCYQDTSIAHSKARIAAANVRLADANDLGKCLDFLKTQKAAGKTFDRPVTRDNACSVAQSMGMHPN